MGREDNAPFQEMTLSSIKENDVKYIRLMFTDMLGIIKALKYQVQK